MNEFNSKPLAFYNTRLVSNGMSACEVVDRLTLIAVKSDIYLTPGNAIMWVSNDSNVAYVFTRNGRRSGLPYQFFMHALTKGQGQAIRNRLHSNVVSFRKAAMMVLLGLVERAI